MNKMKASMIATILYFLCLSSAVADDDIVTFRVAGTFFGNCVFPGPANIVCTFPTSGDLEGTFKFDVTFFAPGRYLANYSFTGEDGEFEADVVGLSFPGSSIENGHITFVSGELLEFITVANLIHADVIDAFPDLSAVVTITLDDDDDDDSDSDSD